MVNTPPSEVWLRGPISVFLHCCNRLRTVCFSVAKSWLEDFRPDGGTDLGDTGWRRSVGFHVRHASGSLDRLFTYARGEQLSPSQRAFLAAETQPDLAPQVGVRLVAAFEELVERALEQLKRTDESALLDARGVGRAHYRRRF